MTLLISAGMVQPGEEQKKLGALAAMAAAAQALRKPEAVERSATASKAPSPTPCPR